MRRLHFLVILVIAALAASACNGSSADSGTRDDKLSAARQQELRDAALAAARVWSEPLIPVGEANLRTNPPGAGGFHHDSEVDCRFKVQEVGGTTPKFYCELPDGELVKIKYGPGNAELPAEVATTRLLVALGFAADRMYVVKRVRCAGCPRYPFLALKCIRDIGFPALCLAGGTDYDRVVNFDSAVVERRLEGRKIEAPNAPGWAWYELEKIDPSRGGASLAEVDAFRLLAAVLVHWDNKSENQRLICPPGADLPDGSCARPLAIMQDVGATFGPTKLDLPNWRSTRVWADGATCTVSMKGLPFNGATFPDRKISEGGRRLLLRLLEQLSDEQLRDLFDGSGMTTSDQLSGEGRNPQNWIGAFKDKVRQIREAGPCPS